jgi:hypothetical protein
MAQQVKTPAVVVDQANLGGIADSPYQGGKGSLAQIVGLDLHSVPGLILVNQKMENYSGDNISDLVKQIQCSDGNKYTFGKTTGKIQKIDSDDNFTDVAQVKALGGTDATLPGTTANATDVGDTDWADPDNAKDGVDSDAATWTSDDANPDYASHYLKLTNLGLSVPDTAVITGVKVEIKRWQQKDSADDDDYIVDSSIRPVVGDTITGEDKAVLGIPWNDLSDDGDIPTFTYGSESESGSWGAGLTPDDVNADDFGVAISVSGVKITSTLNVVANIGDVHITVYYRDSAGSNAEILDAREYYGYIYYAQAGKMLGRWKVGDSWDDRDDNYGVFFNGDTDYHPMQEQNLVLYIGDGNYVAQVDASQDPTIFSSQALQIPSGYTVSTLGTSGTNLLVGSRHATNLNKCGVFEWTTWSSSFTAQAWLDEVGVNSILDSSDGVTIINAGLNGNIYLYDPNYKICRRVKQFPPSFPTLYSPTQTGVVLHNAIGNKQGIPLLGFSRVDGNVASQGLYGFGSRNISFPRILTLEFLLSTGNLNNITIWDILVVGNEIFVSYQDDTPVDGSPNTQYRIDKLDWNNKQDGAYFETKVLKYSRILLDNYRQIIVNYNSLPDATKLDLYYKINHGEYVKFVHDYEDTDEFINDPDHNFMKEDKELEAKTLQIKVVFSVNDNDAPMVEDTILLVQ